MTNSCNYSQRAGVGVQITFGSVAAGSLSSLVSYILILRQTD